MSLRERLDEIWRKVTASRHFRAKPTDVEVRRLSDWAKIRDVFSREAYESKILSVDVENLSEEALREAKSPVNYAGPGMSPGWVIAAPGFGTMSRQWTERLRLPTRDLEDL